MNDSLSPYISIDKSTWASLKDSLKLNISERDLKHYCSTNDQISMQEVSDVYLPLSRLLNLYFKTKALRRRLIFKQFIGQDTQDNEWKAPFIISIAGSVAVGKSTTARLLQAILQDWDCAPKVSLVTTDGFLYPNEILEQKNILNKKGFPISYDIKKLLQFVSDAKSGKRHLEVPQYSHLTYDIIPSEKQIIDNPDILIIEGLNVLQSGLDYPNYPHHVFLSDFFDFSIYVDADPNILKNWFLERFSSLRSSAFSDPNCYFHNFTQMSEEEALSLASSTWDSINYVNLIENILPTKYRASLILEKGLHHEITTIKLRK